MKTRKDLLFVCFFLAICIAMLFISKDAPIGDFGNYYYGSRIFVDKGDASILYKDIHGFNEQIKNYGETIFFENYTPVPPFSVLFYYPFIFIKAGSAKLLFNILSALFLGVSIFAFLRLETGNGLYRWGIFPALILPLYSNFVQGQSYALITALLLLVYVTYKKRNYVLTACCIALLFHLKIFPALILVYFLFRRDYKVVVLSVAAMVALLAITTAFMGAGLVFNYYSETLPRLFKNEIIEPFYYGHQSIHILFQNVFVYDALSNPSPLLNSAALATVCEALIIAALCYLMLEVVEKNEDAKIFGFFAFFIVLINKYVPGYALIMLLPFILTLNKGRNSLVVFLLLTVACNLPLSSLSQTPLLIKYSRLLLLLLAFVLVLREYRPALNGLRLSATFLLVLVIMIPGVQRAENFYLKGINNKGVFYDLNVHEQLIILNRCMGQADFCDTLRFPEKVRKIVEFDSHPLLNRTNDKKIFLVNDNTLLYLSDSQQGVGIFRPRLQRLR